MLLFKARSSLQAACTAARHPARQPPRTVAVAEPLVHGLVGEEPACTGGAPRSDASDTASQASGQRQPPTIVHLHEVAHRHLREVAARRAPCGRQACGRQGRARSHPARGRCGKCCIMRASTRGAPGCSGTVIAPWPPAGCYRWAGVADREVEDLLIGPLSSTGL